MGGGRLATGEAFRAARVLSSSLGRGARRVRASFWAGYTASYTEDPAHNERGGSPPPSATAALDAGGPLEAQHPALDNGPCAVAHVERAVEREQVLEARHRARDRRAQRL